MDRHLLYLPVCVFTYRFVRPVGHRHAGRRRFRVDSQPKGGWPVCCRRAAQWAERRRGLHRLY